VVRDFPVRVWRRLPLRLRTRMHVWRSDRERRRRVRLGDLNRTMPIERHLGRTRGGPIDRYYIERFLLEHRADIRGRALEVGDSGYVDRLGTAVERVDVLDIDPANARATIVADVTDLAGVEDDTFECIVLTQVLQLVYEPAPAFRSLARVLAPGGVLLATIPGIVATAPGKGDFWRFTAEGVRRLAADAFGADAVDVHTYGNVLAATGFLYGLGQNDFDAATLDEHDPFFEVTVAVRAVKAGAAV
jgi:SAM-dependent methyltransferase